MELGKDPVETTIDVEEQETSLLVRLVGELDVSNVDQLEHAIGLASSAGDAIPVVFDMSGLRFMDSSVLAVLLRVAAYRVVHLREPSMVVQEVIEATGLSDVLRIEP